MKREGTVALLVLAVGAGTAWALARGQPVPEVPAAETATPVVRTARAEVGSHRVVVRAHGTVEPRTVSELVAEVSGRVTWVAPALAAGGFFEPGQVLLEIDRVDYRSAVRQARAARDRTRSELDLQAAELARALALAERRVLSASTLDERRHSERIARAALEESQAALERANRDLERTRLRAPFAGRVRGKKVDVGQFVRRGDALASLYAVDFAEVRLPVRDEDLAFLDLPLGRPDAIDVTSFPEVVLQGRFAGREHVWRGRIVRSEGEIDARSRMFHLVARVDDPYGHHDAAAPLAMGLFVSAEIQGRQLHEALEVPRAALRDGDHVLVVDGEDRLRIRPVEVLRQAGERVLVRTRIEPDERLCLSPVDRATDGMRVRPIDADSDGDRETGPGAHAS